MGPARLLARAQRRRRRLALTALTLLVGVVGGLAMAIIAGSRRSATVVDRYFTAGIPYDVLVGFEAPGGSSSITRDDLLALPDVVRADPRAYVAMTRLSSTGTAMEGIDGQAVAWASLDPTIRLLEGAVPDGTDPSQVMVNEAFVEVAGLTVGDVVDVQMFGLDQEERVEVGDYVPSGPRYTLQITAVMRGPFDIAVADIEEIGQASANAMFVSYEFYERHHEEFLHYPGGYDVQLSGDDGARDDFVAAVEALGRQRGEHTGIERPRFSDSRVSLAPPVQLETNALLLLGAGIAVALLVTVALVLRAEERAHEADEPTLRSLGVTSRQLGATALLRVATVAVGGAALAVVIALSLSPEFPVGIGRQLELDPGPALDGAVVAVGAAVILLAVGGLSYLFGRASPRRMVAAPTAPSLAARLARVGMPAELVIGAHLTLAGGPASRSRRAGIAGGAAAVAIVAAVGLFLSGVDHVYSVPTAHGWAWDAVIGNSNFPLSPATAERLRDDPRIEAASTAQVCLASVRDEPVEALAIEPDGTAPPVLQSGRLPASAAEIALGARLARELGAGVGDPVRFSVAGGDCAPADGSPPTDLDLTVVGVALPPVFTESNIGEGALVTLDAIAAAGRDPEPQLMMARLRGDDAAAVAASLDADYTEEIKIDMVPAEVANLHRVRGLPLIGLLLAGALGTLLLLYTLAVNQLGERHDLAVLRTLGLVPSQLRRALAWKGVMLAGGMVLIGLPLGVAAGRALWRRSAADLGAELGPITPWLLLLVPLSVVVALLATALPARRARRTSVAALLRAE